VNARRALSTGLALVSAAGIFAAVPTASAAPSLADAKAQAAQLAAQVNHLTDEAELATEDYNAAQEQLAQAATSYLGIQAQLDDAYARDTASDARVNSQTASLYEAGGAVPLYAEALNGSDLGDVVERISMAGSVLHSTQVSAHRGMAQTQHLAALNAKLAATAARQSKLQADTSLKRARVRDLLGQQSALLAAANSRVRTITIQLQQAAAKKAAEAFAAKLAAAQALAAQQQQQLAQLNLLTGAAAPTAAAGQALLAAQSRIGTPYVWGATGPGAFDCSGLTSWAYAQAGIGLPRTSREQWNVGHHVALADLQPGDLLFWAINPNDPATIHHVAIYAGNDMMIAAPHTGSSVQLQQVYLNGYIGATRPTG
jgi:peptidoglycan DL-endopeptidase CwlO